MNEVFVVGPEQRNRFRRLAAYCGAGGALLTAVASLVPLTLSDRIFAGSLAAIGWLIGLYYLRAASGWVSVQPDGLHTSRWLRGRRIKWSRIKAISTYTYSGKAGGVTVVKVYLKGRPPIILPAPRSSVMDADKEFHRSVSRLLRLIPHGIQRGSHH